MGVGNWKAAKEQAKRGGKRTRDSKPQHFMSESFSIIPAKEVNEIKPKEGISSRIKNRLGLGK